MSRRQCLLCGREWVGDDGSPPETKCPHCGDAHVRIVPPRVSKRTKIIAAGAVGGLLLLALSVPWAMMVLRETSGVVQTPDGPGKLVTISGRAEMLMPNNVLYIRTGDYTYEYVWLDPDAPRPGFLENRRVRVRAVEITEGPRKGALVMGRVTSP